MSHFNSDVCSDEELFEELRKLGYDNVSSDVINLMKNDLAGLIDESPISEYEVNSVSNRQLYATKSNRSKGISRKTKSRSQNVHASKSSEDNFPDGAISEFQSSKVKNKSNNSREQLNEVDGTISDTSAYLKKANKVKQKQKIFTSADVLASRSDYVQELDSLETRPKCLSTDNSSKHGHSLNKNSNSPKAVRKSVDKIKKTHKSKETSYSANTNDCYDTSLKHDFLNKNSSISQKSPKKDVIKTKKTALKNKEEFSNTNPNETLYSSVNTTSSSLNSDIKTMKRKILRRKNGQSIITEEILEVPSLFETSYPADSESSPNNKFISNDDLSPKSNDSTGSVSAVSPETCLKSSISTVSINARMSSLRIHNSRKKKSDPVAMYNYYKKFWNSYKPPGENTHDKLRWAVRDRMLDYNM